eukprot:scaffold212299_cov18-Tisochrysis_lutea.AAC.1
MGIQWSAPLQACPPKTGIGSAAQAANVSLLPGCFVHLQVALQWMVKHEALSKEVDPNLRLPALRPEHM